MTAHCPCGLASANEQGGVGCVAPQNAARQMFSLALKALTIGQLLLPRWVANLHRQPLLVLSNEEAPGIVAQSAAPCLRREISRRQQLLPQQTQH